MIDSFNYMMNVIYIDLTKLDATIVSCPGTPTYMRHLAGGRVLKYPIAHYCKFQIGMLFRLIC